MQGILTHSRKSISSLNISEKEVQVFRMSVHFHPFKFSVFSSIKQLLFTTLFDGRFVGLVALKNLIDWAVEDLPGFLLVF